MPGIASIIAKGYCDLYSLDKETFDMILARYPSFAETIKDLGHYELVRRIPGSNKWIFLDKNLIVENYIDNKPGDFPKHEYSVRAVNVSEPGPRSDIVKID